MYNMRNETILVTNRGMMFSGSRSHCAVSSASNFSILKQNLEHSEAEGRLPVIHNLACAPLCATDKIFIKNRQ